MTILKLEDPDVIGNDILPIIKLQENFYNKNQLGKTEPIHLTSSPNFMPKDKMSAAQNNGRAFSTLGAVMLAHKWQSLMTNHGYLIFFPQYERHIKKFIN